MWIINCFDLVQKPCVDFSTALCGKIPVYPQPELGFYQWLKKNGITLTLSHFVLILSTGIFLLSTPEN
jgi:hypothetical protein